MSISRRTVVVLSETVEISLSEIFSKGVFSTFNINGTSKSTNKDAWNSNPFVAVLCNPNPAIFLPFTSKSFLRRNSTSMPKVANPKIIPWENCAMRSRTWAYVSSDFPGMTNATPSWSCPIIMAPPPVGRRLTGILFLTQ